MNLKKLNPMKRDLLLAALCLVCVLLLIGCGNGAPAAAPSPATPPAGTETSAPTETAAPAPEESPAAVPEESPAPASAEPAPAETDEPAPAALPDAGLVRDSGTEPSPAETLFELAKGYVDKPLSELQAEIGEPVSVTYVSSCLIPGGQDGELHYDGFTVYTVKSSDSETVQDVIAD